MAKEASLSSVRRVRDTPVVEILANGESVGVVNARIEHRPGRLEVLIYAVPVTRIGRTLPDWPRALSLKPDVGKRRN